MGMEEENQKKGMSRRHVLGTTAAVAAAGATGLAPAPCRRAIRQCRHTSHGPGQRHVSLVRVTEVRSAAGRETGRRGAPSRQARQSRPAIAG